MSAEEQVPIEFNKTETMVVGTLSPEANLDADGSRVFGDEVVAYLSKHPGVKLLLNFHNITYLSSAALSELLRINETAKNNGSAVQLCGLSKEIHKVFEITQLSNVFKVSPEEDLEKTIMRLNSDSEWDVYRA